MEEPSVTAEELQAENKLLLDELATAYQNMEMILLQASREKEIAYKELESKYHLLQNTYAELSKKENLLIHLEKLSSIGQFITEIIHELNNPLTIISAVSQLIMMQEIPENLQKPLEKIPQQVKRMMNYLNRFKAMAYKSKEQFQYFDINANLLDFLETIEIIKPKNIKITRNISSKPLPVHGDPYQINQIYLNLAKNAFDAMSEKGSCLEISSREITSGSLIEEDHFGRNYCQNAKDWEEILNTSNRFAMVEFRDDAMGIPSELLADIFTPFFTTKERGKGTGLGLSIVTDIANRHNANLAVRSDPGEGTVFKLLIPLAEVTDPPEHKKLLIRSEGN